MPTDTDLTGDQQSPIALDDWDLADLPPLTLRYSTCVCDVDHNGYSIHVVPTEHNELRIGDEVLTLRQFHFHTPSEHTLTGEQFPIVIHLVHTAEDGAITVLCVFGRIGPPNAGLATLAEAAPADADHPEITAHVDPTLVVGPLDDYLMYGGSLTTPPYSEGVRWIVLVEPITVSEEQVAQFADNTPHNARELQPRSGRRVLRRRR